MNFNLISTQCIFILPPKTVADFFVSPSDMLSLLFIYSSQDSLYKVQMKFPNSPGTVLTLLSLEL